VRAGPGGCDGHRYPLRDRVMMLLNVRAGLRAKEIACIKWCMVTDTELPQEAHKKQRNASQRVATTNP
jgi:hypothetical protein